LAIITDSLVARRTGSNCGNLIRIAGVTIVILIDIPEGTGARNACFRLALRFCDWVGWGRTNTAVLIAPSTNTVGAFFSRTICIRVSILSINSISASKARVDIAALATATGTLVLDTLARRVGSTVRIGAHLAVQGIFIVYANVIRTGILCALYSIITGSSGGTSPLDIGPNIRLLR